MRPQGRQGFNSSRPEKPTGNIEVASERRGSRQGRSRVEPGALQDHPGSSQGRTKDRCVLDPKAPKIERGRQRTRPAWARGTTREPQIQAGSTQGRSRVEPGSTPGRTRVEQGSNKGRARVESGSNQGRTRGIMLGPGWNQRHQEARVTPAFFPAPRAHPGKPGKHQGHPRIIPGGQD